MPVVQGMEHTTGNQIKVAVIGGGSSYTPELVNGFLQRVEGLPVAELWLMDPSRERLEVVGGFARRLVAARGSPFAVRLTMERREAIESADYVITQLRVGGMQARRADEYLGHRHGLVGQETTGVGGMAKALRTIPVILETAREMAALAPGALLVNFTNPAGLITEALGRHAAAVPSVGVCNVPITFTMHVLAALEEQMGLRATSEGATLDTLGLNHLSWHRGFAVDGQDLWPQVLEGFLARVEANPAGMGWDRRTVEVLGMIPNDYVQYYYYTARKVAGQEGWPPSRAEEVMAIEERLLALCSESTRSDLPDDLLKRGGAYYSTVATQLLNAHYNDLNERHILNVPHRGAVPGWPDDWVLEMPCWVGKAGILPLPAEPLPPTCFGLLAQVKAFEILTVEAAVRGDRDAAYQALLTHPLGPSADRVQAVLDDLLEVNRPHLPQFWR